MFLSWDTQIFVFLLNLQISKYVMPSQTLLHNGTYIFSNFFGILRSIKMKFLYQIIVYLTASISNMFLVQFWGMKTSSRLIDPFKKNETLETWYNLLLSNWSRLLNKLKRAWDLAPLLQIIQKISKKYYFYFIYQLTKFGRLMSCDSNEIFKNASPQILMLIITSWI